MGPLRISGPVSFGIVHLGPALFGFLAKNPQIDLTPDLDDRFVSKQADVYAFLLWQFGLAKLRE